MAIPPADPNQYFTPTFDKDMPQSTATHFRQLYLASSQHDQAIKLIHQQVTTPTTTTVTTTSSAPVDTRVIPGNTPAIASEWLNSYNSTSGSFTQTQPAYSDISGTPTLPANTPAITHDFITAYNSTTGAFSQAQPAFTDISGQITTAQLPASGVTHVVPLGPLTVGGTTGSITVTNGIITAFVDPT